MKSIVTSKGQVTIPKGIRDQLHIIIGSELDFCVQDGIILIRPLTKKLSSLKGLVKSKRKSPVTLEEMKDTIRKRAKETMK